MSKRSRTGSRVKGPNSALTEFLREEGITEAFRQRREAQLANERHDEQIDNEGDEVVIRSGRGGRSESPNRREGAISQADDDSDFERQVRLAARRKRKTSRMKNKNDGGFPSDSDDDDDDDDDFENGNDYNGSDRSDINDDIEPFKKFGEEDICVKCGETFQLTVYSRYLESEEGYICDSCNERVRVQEHQARKNQLNARKRRRKIAQALLDKTSIKIPTLQDICIKKISEHIGEVEALGDIGQMNLNKISRILSKNRSLNDATVSLFFTPGMKSLEFCDCSKVDSDSFSKLAAFCPELEDLKLFMCGQLHNDNIKYFSANLKKLRHLALDGPFLISDITWQEYFEDSGSRLKSFEVRNTHRFGNDSLISLLENCGSNLSSLKLSRLDGLDSRSVYELLPHYLVPNKLQVLEISYPHKEELISDDLLINILSIVGESLKSLNLDGCSNLTDRFLLEGLTKFCPNLTHLSLNYLDQLTDEGFSRAFSEYSFVNSGGLMDVQVRQCTGLGDCAVYSLMKHSSGTIVELNLNGLYRLRKNFLLQVFMPDSYPSKEAYRKRIARHSYNDDDSTINEEEMIFDYIELPLLTSLDIGFVRSMDDEVLKRICESCKKLTILEVFGDNRCTSRVSLDANVLIIGRQHDSI